MPSAFCNPFLSHQSTPCGQASTAQRSHRCASPLHTTRGCSFDLCSNTSAVDQGTSNKPSSISFHTQHTFPLKLHASHPAFFVTDIFEGMQVLLQQANVIAAQPSTLAPLTWILCVFPLGITHPLSTISSQSYCMHPLLPSLNRCPAKCPFGPRLKKRSRAVRSTYLFSNTIPDRISERTSRHQRESVSG